MKINRKSIAAGLTVGLLAGGAGGAIAATTAGSRISTTPSTTTSSATPGWDGHGYGWGNGATGWRGPATRGGWDASGGDTDIAGARCGSLARSGRRASEAYLGLSASQLDSRLRSGNTLAEIAASHGKSVAGLERAIEAAVTDSVNTDSTLSSSQKSSIIANLTSVVDSVVTGTWDGPVGPRPGWSGGPMAGTGWSAAR
jgi:hypothetical protein